jgi:acetamidase/formamidase
MATNTQEFNSISQIEKVENFTLTIELAQQILDNLSEEKGDKLSCDIFEVAIQVFERGYCARVYGIDILKDIMQNELDKITLEMTGNNWDKNHKFNQLLTLEQLFDWLKTLQRGRRIREQRKLARLID